MNIKNKKKVLNKKHLDNEKRLIKFNNELKLKIH